MSYTDSKLKGRKQVHKKAISGSGLVKTRHPYIRFIPITEETIEAIRGERTAEEIRDMVRGTGGELDGSVYWIISKDENMPIFNSGKTVEQMRKGKDFALYDVGGREYLTDDMKEVIEDLALKDFDQTPYYDS